MGWCARHLDAVRHGQSTANVAFSAAEMSGSTEPVRGRDRDVPLSELGAAQSSLLGNWLAGQPPGREPDLVVCSPYLRAWQTWDVMADRAANLGKARLHALVDERLRDREMGVFELHPPAALHARSPEEAARREVLGEWCYRPPGGEAFTDVAVRVGQFVSDLGRAAPGRRVLIVAHDGVIIALRHVAIRQKAHRLGGLVAR
ncbi:histidine phosphatase family protein [Streptomyces camponoticapitis]|nr:histidine phosphatase family protein [Streptomyces camponoticapitis]